ncbi:hypothetical protein NDU88_003479 [Pleurodeles waltl]|uniref:Uncharacterized protein n=1 Tax=Pleurodeles waltl TaxID=8319 RepID=A0AAV7W7K1_PLEWA|nr:hypothetical protein NDU88_003479 [Pleurodeles waltl]
MRLAARPPFEVAAKKGKRVKVSPARACPGAPAALTAGAGGARAQSGSAPGPALCGRLQLLCRVQCFTSTRTRRSVLGAEGQWRLSRWEAAAAAATLPAPARKNA